MTPSVLIFLSVYPPKRRSKDFAAAVADVLCLFLRLESGNSIEEKLLKNGTKDLIREVAAQGTDYTLAFLTQVR